MNMTTSATKGTSKGQASAGPTKQPAPPPKEAQQAAAPGPKKAKEPKRFSLEESDIKLSDQHELVYLAQEKAHVIFRRVANEGIARKKAFAAELHKVAADKDIDDMIAKTLVWTKDNDQVKAGDDWLDQSDLRRSFVKAFAK